MSTKIRHDRYEEDWMRAFPLGNGRIGAMVYGSPLCERIEINEESLWSGKPLKEECNSSPQKLQEIRDLLFDGKFKEARILCDKTFLAKPERVRFYESFGEIFIDYHDKSEYTDYEKELELSEAIAKVSYKKNGIKYTSETFVDDKYDVFVYRMTADKPFGCDITMSREKDSETSVIDENTIELNGRITWEKDEPVYGEAGEGMSFGARICINSDGVQTVSDKAITVTGATYVTVYSAFETNYNVLKYDIDETIDYKLKLAQKTKTVTNAEYEKIKEQHITEHKKLFDNVIFELDSPDVSDIPTDERLKRVIDGSEDFDLYTLYYNFGRYLLIESSGKRATLPANLQGIWCNGLRPPWGSDYHTNINLQMNYWPAECANMPETVNPFIHFMKMIAEFGKTTAQDLFGAEGWTINHTTDIFGRTGVHDAADCGFLPMAGPWLCLNLWEHYEYTQDIDYLKEIYPILKGSCEFIKSYLIETKDGYLVSCPSNSPENKFYYTDENGNKEMSMFTYGTTMDNEIIYALLTRVISACEMLGCDTCFVGELKTILSKLPPLKVSERYGTICEWIEDFEETEPGHRHISHLFGLYPADQINENDAEIYEAAKRTIARRIENGGGATGWSRAWIINFYARLKDGKNAWYNLQQLMKLSTAENLFDMHPPFQIDGNFGAVSGITEMLIQSHLGKAGERITEILPALPDEWENGRIKGVRARGNFEFDIEWSDKKLTSLYAVSVSGGVLRLRLPESEEINIYEMQKGERLKLV